MHIFPSEDLLSFELGWRGKTAEQAVADLVLFDVQARNWERGWKRIRFALRNWVARL